MQNPMNEENGNQKAVNASNGKGKNKSGKKTKSYNRQSRNWKGKGKGSKSEPHNYQDKFADAQKARGEKAILSEFNDSKWYTKNEVTLRDVASFSYLSALGRPFRLNRCFRGNNNHALHFDASTASVPGVYALSFLPTIGPSATRNSAANVAAQAVFSKVRQKISGQRKYEATDLMMYYLSLDNIYLVWNWAKRAVGYVSKRSQLNDYMPEAYARADNIDYNDLVSNLANFRGSLNAIAADITSFPTPAVFSYNVRHSWLVSNIWKDSDTKKAQQYMFVPAAVYTLDETSSDQGTLLKTIPIQNVTPWTTSKIIELLRSLIQNLQYCEDIDSMAADTLTAYGSELFTLSPLMDDYTVDPVYSAEVLSQIENTQGIAMTAGDIAATNISQSVDTLTIVMNLKATQSGNFVRDAVYLNMHKEDITPADTIVATRLTSCVYGWNNDGYLTDATYGSEIVVDENIIYFANNTTNVVPTDAAYNTLVLQKENCHGTIWQVGQNSGANSTPAQIMKQLIKMSMITSFDWAPIKYLLVPASATVDWMIGTTADWDMYTMVTSEDLDSMNHVALMSEFNIPDYGTTF